MKVFVSSTYEDLLDHRRAVDDILARLAAQFKGMEYFGARPFDPKIACFTEIQRCDLFVGIYAHRYGWIPDRDTLSITEQEFDEARRANKPCYCYVIADEHPWNPKLIEVPALDKIKRLHAKIGSLVRSRFSTPDNLAKQVSADLIAAITGRNTQRSPLELIEFVRTCAMQEIATTIGTKYIRDLYVWRNLDDALDTRLLHGKGTPRNLKDLAEGLGVLKKSHAAVNLKNTSTGMVTDSELLQALRDRLQQYAELSPTAIELNYPASELSAVLTQVRSLLQRLQVSAQQARFPQHSVKEQRELATNLETSVARLAEATQALRPVYLIVDRAGGGKTNLLCNLAERAGLMAPTFFIAAKSVPTGTATAIQQHLASVYPTSKENVDPITEAISAVRETNGCCLVIIDGINEHHEPLAFNAALKDLVRRYYQMPVRFVVSCRDIYWRYFDDEWWSMHGALFSHDALYSFTRIEYRRALPLYLEAFDIDVTPIGEARDQLHHPLLLRFFCEAYRGSPAAPTRMGTLSELRLLDLFGSYCDRKFEHIRQRLGLYDVSEIHQFLSYIALSMLEHRTRMLPIRRVMAIAQDTFGLRSFRKADSPYMQILDEDILIEEQPLTDLSDTIVTFVYDAFMEYMIAGAIWADVRRSDTDRLTAICKHLDLLKQTQAEFISVFGVLLFLGEMINRHACSTVLAYIEELLNRGFTRLACDLIVRLSTTEPRQGLYARLLLLLKQGSRKQKHEAWQAISKLAGSHWPETISFLATSDERVIDGARAFSLLQRGAKAMKPDEAQSALSLIHDALFGGFTAIEFTRSIDRATAINAASALSEHLLTGNRSPDEFQHERQLNHEIQQRNRGEQLIISGRFTQEWQRAIELAATARSEFQEAHGIAALVSFLQLLLNLVPENTGEIQRLLTICRQYRKPPEDTRDRQNQTALIHHEVDQLYAWIVPRTNANRLRRSRSSGRQAWARSRVQRPP